MCETEGEGEGDGQTGGRKQGERQDWAQKSDRHGLAARARRTTREPKRKGWAAQRTPPPLGEAPTAARSAPTASGSCPGQPDLRWELPAANSAARGTTGKRQSRRQRRERQTSAPRMNHQGVAEDVSQLHKCEEEGLHSSKDDQGLLPLDPLLRL